MPLEKRSYEQELLDHDDVGREDLFKNLKELDSINRQLGGYAASAKGVSLVPHTTRVHTVLDIGFGGGDTIKYLSDHPAGKNGKLFFFGVDRKQDCVSYAEDNLFMYPNKKLFCCDYRNLPEGLLKHIDLIHCSLFLHHLKDEEIIHLFRMARENNCILLVNDLERNLIAYYGIRILTLMFSNSHLVRNDAPLSVKRGFRKNELEYLLKEAGYTNYTIRRSWAFRYIILALP